MTTYRERLLIEGLTLAAAGALGCVLLIALADGALDGPGNTLGQLLAVAALLAWFGPRSVHRAAAAAGPVEDAPQPVTGEPTPLWHVVAACAGLTLLIGLPTGAWDAGLRVTGGCVLVGLAQATLLRRAAAQEEQRLGGALVRVRGSRIVLGTRLAVAR